MSYQQYMNTMGFGVPGSGHPYMMGFQGALPMQMPQMANNQQQYMQNHRPAANAPAINQPAPSKSGKRKLIGDPNRPKRPTSAYFYFVAIEREEAAKRGEKITRVTEWTKQISVKWRELTVTEKDVFQGMASTDKIRYTTQMAAYTGKDANRPKRPQSAYFLWLADFRARMKNQFIENKDILRAAGEEWRQMTTIVKAPYEQLAEEERRKYEQAMKLYNMNGSKKVKLEAAASTDIKSPQTTTSNAQPVAAPPSTSAPIQYSQQVPTQAHIPPAHQQQQQLPAQQQMLQQQMQQQQLPQQQLPHGQQQLPHGQQQQQQQHSDEYDDDDDDGDDEDGDFDNDDKYE